MLDASPPAFAAMEDVECFSKDGIGAVVVYEHGEALIEGCVLGGRGAGLMMHRNARARVARCIFRFTGAGDASIDVPRGRDSALMVERASSYDVTDTLFER